MMVPIVNACFQFGGLILYVLLALAQSKNDRFKLDEACCEEATVKGSNSAYLRIGGGGEGGSAGPATRFFDLQICRQNESVQHEI